MTPDAFKKFHTLHFDKLFEAWNQIPEEKLKKAADLNTFCALIEETYRTPKEVILKELDAVEHNIREGIRADFAPRLDPEE